MKIAYISDTHYEIDGQRDIVLHEEVDVLILAGDISKNRHSIVRGQQIADGKARHIVQIAGNHDYWSKRHDKVLRLMREEAAKYTNHHFLENDTVLIDGWAFIGATLWTDFAYGSNIHLDLHRAKGVMNDYRKISRKASPTIYRKIIPEDILEFNTTSKKYIFEEIEKHGRDKSIVISHHGPTELSVIEKFRGDKDNVFYVNGWGNEVAYNGPRLWFHGHTHAQFEYEIGDTTVMCNAFGYPGETGDNGVKLTEL